jgi:alcohol dehydrogenase
MLSFAFSIATPIQFGMGSSRQAGEVVKGLLQSERTPRGSRVLVISDPGIANMPWRAEILRSLDICELQYEEFERVRPNPREQDVQSAASRLSAGDFGAVVAVGGGSTMDTAKVAALIAAHGGSVADYAGWAKVPGPAVPLVAIPTTAGSGSEVTSWAVISEADSHRKLAIGDPNLAPRQALVDPELTTSLPQALTAATGMDVLVHAIEAFVGAVSNPPSNVFALEAIRLVGANLVEAATHGDDLQARQAMMMASTLGGVVINNADVAGVHCLSEAVGGFYDAPHGLLNAIFLPYVMAFWESACADKFARIAESLGGRAEPREALPRVKAIAKALDIPPLPRLGIRSADLPKLAELAEANVSNASNPVPMRAAEYLMILEQALKEYAPAS